MSEIDIFVQGEGIPAITLVRVPHDATVRAIMEAAKLHGLRTDEAGGAPSVFLEDSDTALVLDTPLKDAGIDHRGRVHIHRCQRIGVTVNFNVRQEERSFPPSATVDRVKRWAAHEFKLSEVDAAEHILQLCNSTVRPDEDTHIGALTQVQSCALCFDLIPKQRVEG